MSEAVARWDSWCEQQSQLGRGALFGAEAIDRAELQRYEAMFWRRGFELAGSLRELLEARGRIWVASINEDGWSEGDGLTFLESIAKLDGYDRHLELSELEGVPSSEQWLLFTGDLEPSWALDHRFGQNGNYGVGKYHQDSVSNHPVRGKATLPCAYANVEAWLGARLDEIAERWRNAPAEQLARAIARVHEPHDLDAKRERAKQHAADMLADREAPWGRLDMAWGELVATTQDPKLLALVFDQVRRDRQHGRPGVRFDDIARGASWPYDYPGPAQVCARLDEGQRRRLMAWAITRAAEERDLTEADVADAVEALRTDGPLPRETLRRISFAGWTTRGRDGALKDARKIDLTTAPGRRRYLARTVALAFADPHPDNVGRVLTMCARSGSGRFSLLDAWGHLEAVLRRGVPVGEERAKEAPSPLIAELSSYLSAHPGPQRQLLEDVHASWLSRLASASPSDRVAGAKLLQQAIKSPKLAEPLAELLLTLGQSPSA